MAWRTTLLAPLSLSLSLPPLSRSVDIRFPYRFWNYSTSKDELSCGMHCSIVICPCKRSSDLGLWNFVYTSEHDHRVPAGLDVHPTTTYSYMCLVLYMECSTCTTYMLAELALLYIHVVTLYVLCNMSRSGLVLLAWSKCFRTEQTILASYPTCFSDRATAYMHIMICGMHWLS